MLGELSRTSSDTGKAPPTVEMTGTIRGGMTVDRSRGWVTYSRAVISLRSVLPPPRGSRASAMHFDLTITQVMRALDKR
jgi:hypothetical protein